MLMKKVLIATDFSPPAQQLFNCVDELKNMGMEEAVLVHVVDIRIGEGTSITLQQSGMEKLMELAEALKSRDIKVKIYTPIGFAASEIVQIAKAENVSLVLIGSRGKSVIKEVFLGSTTFDVIRLTDTPVLIEKYEKKQDEGYVNVCINKFQKILLPIDFSDCSSNIIELAKSIVPIVQEVVLLSVIEQAENQEQINQRIDQYQRLLEETAKEFKQLGVNTKIYIEEGVASKHITAIADDEGVTSIMMGTRGKGLIKALLLGSTSDAVARTSKRPVVLIPCT